MTTNSSIFSKWDSKPGRWFSIVAIIALLWNIGGAMQFINSLSPPEAGGMMTPEQLEVISSLPAWVSLVFAIGVITSLIGSVLLYLRYRSAMATLLVSFASFLLLTFAYIIYDVFEAIGTQQVVVMATVDLIALGLVLLSRMIPGAK
jgi:hypothetical protein